jgi:hypothetical protein
LAQRGGNLNFSATSCKYEYFIMKYITFCGEKKNGACAACLRKFSKYTCEKVYVILSMGGGVGQLVSKGSTT